MRSLFPFMACVLCALVTVSSTRGAEPTSPQVVPIAENERVVHFVGDPFIHAYCKPNLETFLVAHFARRGLAYRRVSMGWKQARSGQLSLRMTAAMLKDMDDLLLVHKPTLVILQPGNMELTVQFRSYPNFDFDAYPKALDSLVGKLRAKGVRVIVCSAVPMGGVSGDPSKLVLPYDRLAGWVTAARETSLRHGAVFVDQFTDAIPWKMVYPSQEHYTFEGHDKSWALFQKQVRFEPDGSRISIRGDSLKAKAEGASVSDVRRDGNAISLLLRNDAGAGPVLLSVDALSAATYVVTIGGKEAFRKTAEELSKGVDVGSFLVSQIGSKEFLAELDAGHAATEALCDIQQFRLPAWVKLADFETQRNAALRKNAEELAAHDARLRAMAVPAPFSITLQPAMK